MLSVQPPIQMGRQELPMESNSFNDIEQPQIAQKVKQQEKKPLFTPTKVILGIAILCILTFASYKVYTIAFPSRTESKMNQSHSKIIQNVESSSGRGQTSSNSGSQASKSTRNSNTAIGVAQTAGKDVISSSQRTSGDGDDQEPSERDNDGQKRNDHLKKNRGSDGTSTEGDSQESISQEDSGDNEAQVAVWPSNGGANSMPLVGSTRN